MRRGMPSRGGWGNDGARHFRPRGGSPAGCRPPRGFMRPLLEAPRFAPPPPHLMRYPYRGPSPWQQDNPPPVEYNRDNYRINRQLEHRNQAHHHNFPREPSHRGFQNDDNNYHINRMGDVDDRHKPGQHGPRPPWAARNNNHPYERQEEIEYHKKRMPQEYSGHRPPASDHYESNSGPTDDSDTFSQSVDDTVDMIRRRLLNRNDPQNETVVHHDQHPVVSEPRNTSEREIHQEQIRKRRPLKPKEVKNCTNIKNTIVNQLFKMDKDRIHKLMDNPQSSRKFEYAMNSLITESQISYNRHMRSAAEKSLNGSRSEIHPYNESDSIYDDVFMKQMQCFVDPQDTVFLEDIKPFVLAELNKVLQIEEFEQQLDSTNTSRSHSQDKADSFDLPNDSYNDSLYYMEEAHTSAIESNLFATPNEIVENEMINLEDENIRNQPIEERKPLFTRRNDPTNSDLSKPSKKINPPDPVPLFDTNAQPLFDTNAQPLTDEDDPFAELDNQYHVAIDHNFIDDDCTPGASQLEEHAVKEAEPTDSHVTPNKSIIKKPASLSEARMKLMEVHNLITEQKIKSELLESTLDPVVEKSKLLPEKVKVKEEQSEARPKESPPKEGAARERAGARPRKRATDQRPAHRKEKRKKSKERSPDAGNKIMNKNIIINVNDCLKTPEKSDATAKSVFNLYFSKSKKADTARDARKSDDDKSKRRDSPLKPPKSKESRRSADVSPGKADIKLKPIDMFTEAARRAGPAPRAAPRNTAQHAPRGGPQLPPPKPLGRKVTRRHTATQVHLKVNSRDTQTAETRVGTAARATQTLGRRTLERGVQTDPVCVDRRHKAANTLERMKEIDLEIQVLIQEKFTIYNSLEKRDTEPSGMLGLGMTVVEVPPAPAADPADPASPVKEEIADSIIEEFTDLPADELEMIAFESVAAARASPKRARRQTLKARRHRSRHRAARPAKAPNISLLEQIIDDDRPLEDMRETLEELETSPTKRKKKTKTKAEQKSHTDYKSMYCIRECRVVLRRLDEAERVLCEPDVAALKLEPKCEPDSGPDAPPDPEPDTFQVDMLDVSEDIVIGEPGEREDAAPRDAVVDNSRAPDGPADAPADGPAPDAAGCRLYDFSTDENLLCDSMTVTGNGDAILAIECIDDAFLAASLDGAVYHFAGDGALVRALRGSNLPVTCLAVVRDAAGTTIYTGSLDSRIRYFDLETGLEKGPECNVLSPIQSMDRAWDTVFVGTRTGFVLQFECKNNMLIPVSTIKFSEQSILALRALKEGPRKVLLVAARSESVTVRDARSGLLLRTLSGPKMTVYTLLYDDGKVYCGTSGSQIQIFDYASGSHTGSHEGGKGAVCLRAAGGLVFAGCYDGCVYVYRPAARAPLAQLRGAGAMLLSLAVVGSKVIAGYKDRSLYIWKIPVNILQEMVL